MMNIFKRVINKIMMNKFKQAIQKAQSDKQERCLKMEDLSSKMNKLIQLSQEQMKDASHENVSFNVSGYSISARSFPWNGWREILIVVPIQVSGDKVGYSNCDEEKHFPVNWEINCKGTNSTWFPSDEEVPKILKAIKESL